MKITIIAGLPGTGKTHLARRLQAQTGAVRLSRDEIRAEMFEPPDYSESEKAAVFETMLELAAMHLREGKDVIVEGMPFSRRSERDAMRRLAHEAGAEFEILHCTCPDEVALRRIRESKGEHCAADRTETLYFEVKSRFEPIGPDEGATTIDTSDGGDAVDVSRYPSL